MDEKKIVDLLETIAQDMSDDAKYFDGKPFTGRTVTEYLGNQGAAIAALANIVKALVESRPTPLFPNFKKQQFIFIIIIIISALLLVADIIMEG